jgi:hypothetical protein
MPYLQISLEQLLDEQEVRQALTFDREHFPLRQSQECLVRIASSFLLLEQPEHDGLIFEQEIWLGKRWQEAHQHTAGNTSEPFQPGRHSLPKEVEKRRTDSVCKATGRIVCVIHRVRMVCYDQVKFFVCERNIHAGTSGKSGRTGREKGDRLEPGRRTPEPCADDISRARGVR